MHEAALAQAALPAPTFILGLPLRPYSLGHELWLIREDNPLVDDCPDLATISHVAQAVLVCSQGWEANLAMRGEWLIGFKLWLWKQRLRRMDWQAAAKDFCDYRAAGSRLFPPSGRLLPGRGPASRRAGAPVLLRLQQFLVTRLRLSQVGAWDYPYGLANMQWQAYWEGEDRLEIYNEDDAEFDAYVREQEGVCPV